MLFTLAHFSDVHLGPVSVGDILGSFRLKRLVGGASWHFRRRHLHVNHIADALRADILAARPDHIAFTGDLVNLAARGEFERGQTWLQGFGAPDKISFVPGNHDSYVKNDHATGLGLLQPYTTGDGRQAEIAFPYVRLRRNIAMIGVSSAQPQALWRAGGELGQDQLTALEGMLAELGKKGFYRAVMVHHPPLPGLAVARKALRDSAQFKTAIISAGAELVIHGHNHKAMHTELPTAKGMAHIIGVPSASLVDSGRHEGAQWHSFSIGRSKGVWQTTMSRRRWSAELGGFVDAGSVPLSHEKDRKANLHGS